MVPADVAFAVLINRTSQYFTDHQPQYMTYTERTHVTAPAVGRSQDINRSIAVRVADDFAVMKDLPNGGERTGQAFPIVSSFDAFSGFGFSWFANLKRVDINVKPGPPWYYQLPPDDPSVNAVVAYFSYWAVTYATDSADDALHLTIAPAPGYKYYFYPSDVVEDPQTQLPSHIEMRSNQSDEMMTFDYKVIEGHWVMTHATWSATQHAFIFTSKVIADVTFDNIAFPTAAPDPRLAGTPAPTAQPSSNP
ncbi:MAG: hypothetical protein JO029_05780 [Candidatus Eremiobacteraeota bacterium]|nr:hypothetical protein [Candidatus Eremiobacteraeota bacterium]MBV8433774.1 hypothetical protein [Candidatus Eremiobacteraeota bacterium]